MMVTFVSQCEKNALSRTRRVLDSFANRIGDNTWQTVITQDGLNTVKKMLRQSASKSTAVSCHWIRSRARSQLLWVVGNRKKFNAEGYVAVNWTERDLVLQEQFALNTEVIANLASIAGYFHDIGKANALFQAKLGVISLNETKTEIGFEPLRHEWVSLRLFQAFVGAQTDQQWLTALLNIDNQAAKKLERDIVNYQDLLGVSIPNPFVSLPPIADMVAWLIVSHHRLPLFPRNRDGAPSFEQIDRWKEAFEPCWNSPQVHNEEWSAEQIRNNWSFPLGTPFDSAFWQSNISALAKRLLNCNRLFTEQWHSNLFTQHLARLSLMLADHAESSRNLEDVNNKDSDRNYLAYANTDKNERGERELKQKLDEHNINVGKLAYEIACSLPALKSKLSTLDRVKELEKTVPDAFKAEFGWQDKAVKLARELQDSVKENGFFGISMASTGKGKTRANAKIMYGVSELGQCRFNVALGLRTLSIQTAKALRSDLFGKDAASQQKAKEKIALLVGSQALRDLQQIDLTEDRDATHANAETYGSASSESLIKDEIDLLSKLSLEGLAGYKWLKHDPKILKLLHAPVLVSTIDYLIPAAEGIRGGRQIAPMLRLLSSDLVLDEPDDFGSADFHALCRLVNWAGMLGSKVLISTATIMPCEAEALFDAYQSGRAEYVKANSASPDQNKVCCAWFDECNKPVSKLIRDLSDFAHSHQKFVTARDFALKKMDKKLRQGKLVEVETNVQSTPSRDLATRIHQSIHELHGQHSVRVVGKQVSIGLVRMANIDPLVAVAKQLFSMKMPENTRVHYCVYHGQYPLLQRSAMEQMLDKTLKRHDFEKWKEDSGLVEIIERHDDLNHIFVVLATSVAEVGRDHDYDWAVVEPSSMRSIIQLAGRVQRHRKQPPHTHNIHVLSKNYKGLKNKPICFEKPGFENALVQYASSNLSELKLDLSSISSCPRIHYNAKKPDISQGKFNQFSEVEHFTQKITLYGAEKIEPNYSARWWQHDVSWNGELQRLQPFRKSYCNKDYALGYFERTGRYRWQEKIAKSYPVKYEPTEAIEIPKRTVNLSANAQLWHQFDLPSQIKKLSDRIVKTEHKALEIYTHVTLQEYDSSNMDKWQYETEFGIYKLLKKDRYQK